MACTAIHSSCGLARAFSILSLKRQNANRSSTHFGTASAIRTRHQPCLNGNVVYALDGIFHKGYIFAMLWEVEYTDEFGQWWHSLTQAEQESLAASVSLLENRGPALGYPHSSAINGSRHGHIGGDKTGDGRWYEVHLPIADRLYDEHLKQLQREGEK
jgi:hypothetical protein